MPQRQGGVLYYCHKRNNEFAFKLLVSAARAVHLPFKAGT
ncbi:protein of unknown function [Methylocella tundrae]|uniref:Transposase n=1 Tax=Methylocella tundrae TaxID=227605 RepID=A0A4U8Z2D2_METTU|nr:protein of unknown function [Methylocella tundrae]